MCERFRTAPHAKTIRLCPPVNIQSRSMVLLRDDPASPTPTSFRSMTSTLPRFQSTRFFSHGLTRIITDEDGHLPIRVNPRNSAAKIFSPFWLRHAPRQTLSDAPEKPRVFIHSLLCYAFRSCPVPTSLEPVVWDHHNPVTKQNPSLTYGPKPAWRVRFHPDRGPGLAGGVEDLPPTGDKNLGRTAHTVGSMIHTHAAFDQSDALGI